MASEWQQVVRAGQDLRRKAGPDMDLPRTLEAVGGLIEAIGRLGLAQEKELEALKKRVRDLDAR